MPKELSTRAAIYLPPNSIRAAIYLRISQDRSGEELGVTRQRSDCEALCASRGWLILGVFTDNDISATKGKLRPGYRDLMGLVSTGAVDKVVCYNTGRLWRNRKQRAEGIDLFTQKGVALVPVKGSELDFSTAAGRMLAGILGEVDTAEVEFKSERHAAEVIQRAERGRPHGGPKMFGVAKDGRTLVPEEADQIRRWSEVVIAGGSLSRLATESGKARNVVRAILLNPRNAGFRLLHGKTYQASNPPIVTEDTYYAVKAILENPKRKTTPGNGYKYFGSGLYECGECHQKVHVGYRDYRTYRCANRSWKADPIDEFVIDLVAGWLEKYGDRIPTTVDAGTKVAREAAAVRKRLEQIGEEFAEDDDADLPEFRMASKRLRERLASLEQQMVATSGQTAVSSINGSPDVFRRLTDPSRKRAIIDSVMHIELIPRTRTPKITWRQ